MTELLNYSSVTAEKPSQFLLMLRTKLAKSDMSQEMIRELFIAKMPENIRNCLIAVKNLSLDELAITADQMISSGKGSAVKNTLFAIDHKKSEQSAASNNSEILSRMDSLEKKLNDVLNFTKSGKSNKFNKQQPFNQFNKGNKWKTREQPDVCWFHKPFGSRAKKCTQTLQFHCGKRVKSTSVAVKVDEDQSPLPHVLDIKIGTKFLVDTGAEVSIIRPTRIDQSFKSYDRSLFAANHSPIATYGNKPLTLQLGSQQKFSWIFIVADVKYIIIGSDFLTHFGMTVNFNKKCLVFENTKSIPLIFEMASKVDYPISFVSENKFSDVLLNYPEVTCPRDKLNKVKHKVTHKIVFEGYPCSARVRQLSPEKLKCAKKEIDELLEAGIIRRSNSPFASALHMVPKSSASGNTFRLCGDYRQINRGAVVDKHPVPNLQTLFHRLGGSSIFSKVDLVKAYHQIPMDEDSIALTAITTPFGLFEHLYMPFGLRNASATFQRFIDHVLQGMSNAIAYVDDIIVFSNSPDEHVKHLNELFSRLKNFGVIVNPTKSQFGL